MKLATQCSDDLILKLKTVTVFGKKIITVLSAEDLITQMTSAPKPALGVLYEGARAVPADNKQLGLSAEVVFSILLLSETSAMSSRVDVATPTHELLDQVRNSIQGTRSPTGHYWKFQLEAAAKPTGPLSVWVQRWSCPVQLPPAK